MNKRMMALALALPLMLLVGWLDGTGDDDGNATKARAIALGAAS